ERAVPEVPPHDVYRDHVGVHRQKQDGYVYVGAAVLRGRISSAQLRAAANLADCFGAGELRTTIMQNLLIPHVPERHADAVARELRDAVLRTDASPFVRGTIACTGALGAHASIARPVGYRCAATEVPEAIERLLRRFEERRAGRENLREFFARHSEDELRAFLAGQIVAAEERDPSPGRVPHGVEG